MYAGVDRPNRGPSDGGEVVDASLYVGRLGPRDRSWEWVYPGKVGRAGCARQVEEVAKG